MINLLPPQIKQEVAFAKINARIVRYIRITLVVIIILAGLFAGAQLNLARRIQRAEASARDKDRTIASFHDLEGRAKQLNSQLTTILAISRGQTKFSQLLSDLAKVTLRGTTITNITLTGDDKKPVRITALADSYSSAVSLRDALVASPRVSAADTENVTTVPGGFKVEIIVGFKPGQAK